MENKVNVMVTFEDTKRSNNMIIPVVCTGIVEVCLDRRFLSHLEDAVIACKELGEVTIFFNHNEVGKLTKSAYNVGEKTANFERFGGKIAKDFYNAIDDAIAELEETNNQ